MSLTSSRSAERGQRGVRLEIRPFRRILAVKGFSTLRQPPRQPWVQARSSIKSASGIRPSSISSSIRITLPMPSTAIYRLSRRERASPPAKAQLTPAAPAAMGLRWSMSSWRMGSSRAR